MMILGSVVILVLVSFLIGGIPFGWIVGRVKGLDVRQAGSGNIGAANVGRLLGRPWGIAVFVLDALKGLVPTVAAGFVLAGRGTGIDAMAPGIAVGWLVCGVCAVLGHNYSPYLGFRGGKGVATSLGVALGIYPELTVPALLALAVWIVATLGTRMTSVGSMSAAAAFPCFFLLWGWMQHRPIAPRWPFLAFCLLTCGFVFLRHRANIRRIVAGTEARIGLGKKA